MPPHEMRPECAARFSTLEQQYKSIDDKLDLIIGRLDTIDYFINGNGVAGAKVRIDRLEGVVGFAKWIGGAVVLGFVGLIIERLWSLFGRH